jgi:hypothetical protein
MKAVVLVVAMSFVYLLSISVAFHFARTNIRNAAFLTRLFFLSIPFAVTAYWATPADLWFLPASLAEPAWIEFLFFLFVYGSTFFGGILQVYALADRGFSLRISVDIDKAGGCMSIPEVIGAYSEGKGTDWMYQKRLDNLTELRLIETHGDRILVTAAGKRIAAPMAGLRAFLRVDE